MQNCTRKNQEIFLQHKMHLCNAVQVVEFRRRQNDEPSKKRHSQKYIAKDFILMLLAKLDSCVNFDLYIVVLLRGKISLKTHTCMFKIGAGAVFGRCRSKPLQLQRPITLNPFFFS